MSELHIKTKEPEFEAVIIRKPDILQFAREHRAELVYVDDDQVVEETYPVISFNPSAPAGQRFKFDTTRADEIREFRDRIAETGAIIKRILGANDA